MSEIAYLTIGTEVSCGDGVCGQLARVVIDPVARTHTHRVVEPAHQRGTNRLVPVNLADPDWPYYGLDLGGGMGTGGADMDRGGTCCSTRGTCGATGGSPFRSAR